jgi:decaprenylphospho-beta-D-ribofuranose 2-oxidase
MLKEKPPAIMCSIKLFKGIPGLLRFEMDGACLAVDFVRCPKTLQFLSTLDSMLVSSGGIPFVIKDSRLPSMVAKKCYPEFEVMKKQLSDYDPDRLFRSEMSERLGL